MTQNFLSFRFKLQQINTKYLLVRAYNILEMQIKSFFCQLLWPGQRDIFFDTFLLPENRNWATDLNVGKQKFIFDQQDLLFFALIPDIAQIVDSPSVVSCAGSVVYPPWDQSYWYITSFYLAVCLSIVPLNQGCEPFTVDLLSYEVSV